MKLLGTQASIQLFWHACRDDWKGERKSIEGRNVEEDAPIPEKAEIKLTDLWKKKHNFVLPDGQLLTAYQQGKVWRDLQLSPPQIDKWFAMKLRTMGEGNPKRTGTTMTFVQGKPVEQLEVVLDAVEDKMELWMRIRAWLFTTAFCTIDKPDFFPLQDAMQTSEHFLKLLTATYRKQRPQCSTRWRRGITPSTHGVRTCE